MAKLVGARVYDAGNQVITTATDTAINFDSERYDYDTIHDNAVNNTRLTCNTAGIYLIIGNIQWDGDAGIAGFRRLLIWLNGATYIARVDQVPALAAAHGQSVSTIYELALTDYVELICRQTSGGNLNILSQPNSGNEFMMSRIG